MANNTTTDRPYKGVYIAVETIIAALAVLGNALVIGAVKRNRGLRNVTFCCLVSLAIADMAVGLVVIPLSILVDSGLQTNFYSCLFMCCNLIIFTNASILSLLAIAIDRYLRIKIPTRYKTLTTKKNIWFCLLVCWLVSFVLGLVPMFGWNKKATEQANNSFIQCSFTTVMRMDYMQHWAVSLLVPLEMEVVWGVRGYRSIITLHLAIALYCRPRVFMGQLYGTQSCPASFYLHHSPGIQFILKTIMGKHDVQKQKLSFESRHHTRQTEQEPLTKDSPSCLGGDAHTDIDHKELLVDVKTSLKVIDAKLDILTTCLEHMISTKPD
ncbi:hypothetical protein NDU88_004864 [Pleurodeles waltl]|uniref:G-protein coupled receptors family 1 profile domain-containing protein n=1 Tax=Pleurodeles waltl TaxID=8319 RepID=A0AAV7QDF9_PLEWA|nr:hypothetical protein NDU88_004864 [Pleurodeles waltl]